MLGRLARWLRILGYDTAYEPQVADAQLIRCGREERRIVLTRDRALASRLAFADRLLLESEAVLEQLRQVVAAFDLDWRDRLFTRCTR